MLNPIQSAIEARSSVHHYQPGRPLDDETIAALVAQATRAPSAYNGQNWRFIAVRSPQAKARLQAAAYGQQKVADASAVFIVCGTLHVHAHLPEALQPCVAAGVLTQSVVDGWVAQARAAHEGNPVLQRDEAVRSASLAAMTLMLAAHGMGLGSCAMAGFDAAQVQRAFALDADALAVLLVTVGYPVAGPSLQKPRKPVSQVLRIV